MRVLGSPAGVRSRRKGADSPELPEPEPSLKPVLSRSSTSISTMLPELDEDEDDEGEGSAAKRGGW